MEERDYYIILYDLYSPLFYVKQKEYFEDYYFNNLSLSEISENVGVSRNAIHKSIKSIEKKLLFYEDNLKLYKKNLEVNNIIKNISDKNIRKKLEGIFYE